MRDGRLPWRRVIRDLSGEANISPAPGSAGDFMVPVISLRPIRLRCQASLGHLLFLRRWRSPIRKACGGGH